MIEVDSDRLILAIVRFLCAAYCTDDAKYWHAALCCAEDTMGPIDGPSFLARAATLVIAIRKERIRDFEFLPAACERASPDEAHLLQMLAAARHESGHALSAAAIEFTGIEMPAATILAARVIVAMQRRYQMLCDADPGNAPPTDTSQRLH